MYCSFCSNTIVIGTLLFFTGYRCEDKDYIILTEEDTGKGKGYFEIMRYCPDCLIKYCLGKKKHERLLRERETED